MRHVRQLFSKVLLAVLLLGFSFAQARDAGSSAPICDERFLTEALNLLEFRFDGRPTTPKKSYVGKAMPEGMKDLDEAHGVVYLTPKEAEQYTLKTIKGPNGETLFSRGGVRAYDTSSGSTVFQNGGGKSIFVMGPDGKIYSSLSQERHVFHHSSFLKGEPVAAAGELEIRNGKLITITNESGHYQPQADQMRQFLTELRSRGIDLRGVTIRMKNDGGTPAFLKFKEECEKLGMIFKYSS